MSRNGFISSAEGPAPNAQAERGTYETVYRRILLLVFAAAAFAMPAMAVPMGPVKPEDGRIAVSFEGSSERRGMEWLTDPRDRSEVERVLYQAHVTYGFTDKIELGFRAGFADMTFTEIPGPFVSGENRYNGGVKAGWGFSYGAILHEYDKWELAGVANFFRHAGHSGDGAIFLTTDYVDYQEWNAGLQYQFRSEKFIPYVGARYSDARMDFDNFRGKTGLGRDTARNNYGLYGGFHMQMRKDFSAFLEGRFLDETAYSGGFRYVFTMPWQKKEQ